MRIRLCAAVRQELGPLPGVALGVGPLAAAVATARLLEADRPDALVLLGSAGAYAADPPVGAVIVAGRMGMASTSATLGLGYAPLAPAPLQGDPTLNARLGRPVASVLTGMAITTDPALAARLGADWQIEHMEVFAVAYACAVVGVPFAAVLGVANRVGPSAHAEWLANRDAVHAAIQAAAAPLLDGAPPAAAPTRVS